MNKELQDIVNSHNNIVILSGAGVSADAGIATFRGNGGIYNTTGMGTIFDRRVFNHGDHIDMFQKMFDSTTLTPTNAHRLATDLDAEGKLLGVVTQNVDRLYEKVGLDDDKLIHIHGVADSVHCSRCKKTLTRDDMFLSRANKYHSRCCGLNRQSGALVDTDMVLFGDDFDVDNVRAYRKWLGQCDLLIVMGTGLDISFHRDVVSELVQDKILINLDAVSIEPTPSWSYYKPPFYDWTKTFIGTFDDILGC